MWTRVATQRLHHSDSTLSYVLVTGIMYTWNASCCRTPHCREHCIEKIAGLTTDNASNMSLAAALAGYPLIRCFAHSLQLAVHDRLKNKNNWKYANACSQICGIFFLSLLLLHRNWIPPDETRKSHQVCHYGRSHTVSSFTHWHCRCSA